MHVIQAQLIVLITHCISFLVIGGANLNPIENPGTSSFEANCSKWTENSLSTRKTTKGQRLKHTLHGQSGVKRKKKQSKLEVKGAFQKRKKIKYLGLLKSRSGRRNAEFFTTC